MTIEIYLKDLTREKRAEIINALGDNGNYDVFPIATLEIDSDGDDTSDETDAEADAIELRAKYEREYDERFNDTQGKSGR